MYQANNHTLKHGIGADVSLYPTRQLGSIDEVWPILQETIDTWKPKNTHLLPKDEPFWSGFMGYISYEAGLEIIDVDLHESCADSQFSDINMVFAHRSIVIDHSSSSVQVQSLVAEDDEWMGNVGRIIEQLSSSSDASNRDGYIEAEKRDAMKLENALGNSHIVRPGRKEYSENIRRCQDKRAAGDSYDLCLTDETHIITPSGVNTFCHYT